MLRKKWFWIIVGLFVLSGISEFVDSCSESQERPKRIDAYVEEAGGELDDFQHRLDALGQDVTSEEAQSLMADFEDISTDRYDADDAKDDEQASRIKRLQDKHERLEKNLERTLSGKRFLLPASGDTLLEGSAVFPVYLERDEALYYDVEGESAVTVRVLNADRQSVEQSPAADKRVSGVMSVRFPAIYLVEVTTRGREYVNVNVSCRYGSLERISHPKIVKEDSENCRKGDFMSKEIHGVKMVPAFEEPRKLTLRGGLKASFSGSKVALVPIQVPKGATDILYNLRISTNEDKPSGEKDFCEGMNTSYRKVRILGLPVYESQGGNSLLTTLLGLNQPVREEDAYINMYVFYDAAQARQFQDGTPARQLKYNLDYSTVGTQSCNGRIPTRGNVTIYLGFENERMRYNNYVWLSALLSTPTTEYVRTRYSVK